LTGKVHYSEAAERDLRRIAIRIAADDPSLHFDLWLEFVSTVYCSRLFLSWGASEWKFIRTSDRFRMDPMWSSIAGSKIMVGSKSSIFGMAGAGRRQRPT
jgi:hypothetical protein